MSLQLTIRFEANDPINDYETNLLSHAYSLLDSLSAESGAGNFLAVPYTSNEEDTLEEIEDELGEEPEEGFDEYEEQVEVELGRRGDFFPVEDLRAMVEGWLSFFEARDDQEFPLDARHTALAGDLCIDLRNVLDTLDLKPKGRARFVIG